MKSMTGYATITGEAAGQSWSWEARSVNGRGLDLRVRVPDVAEGAEAAVRKAAQDVLARGNVTVSLRLDRARAGVSDIAGGLERALADLQAAQVAADGAGVPLAPITAADLVQLAERRANGPAEEANPPWLAPALAQLPTLFAALDSHRAEEGRALHAILSEAVVEVESLAGTAREQAGERDSRLRDVLRARIEAILSETRADPARLEQELALIAVKSDVSEELDRLAAHVVAARALLAEEAPVGRKLDFLCQEFNREANTLCSKAGSEALTRTGLALKVVIDRIREQVQNVE
ncbi:MAG: YicC/YloC family endoribonuclease [Rubricella sp.]